MNLSRKQNSISVIIARAIYKLLSKLVLTTRGIRHYEPSIIHSVDDQSAPNDFLMGLVSRVVPLAWAKKIQTPEKQLKDSVFYNVFPGEHYRLLKAITSTLNPAVVLEIGTYTGMGSVAILDGMKDGKLHTFDVIPWEQFESHLTHNHFQKGRMVQHIANLSDDLLFNQYQPLLDAADIIFLDAPKDGKFEYRILKLFQQLAHKPNKLLILDDIRFVNMTDLWRGIQSPKIDITSFGHWSGTGIVDISDGLKLVSSGLFH